MFQIKLNMQDISLWKCWVTYKKRHSIYYFIEISPQGCFSNKPSFKKKRKKKHSPWAAFIWNHHDTSCHIVYSFTFLLSGPTLSHRQKRIILSQRYLGTLKVPYSLLDWHVWPGGLQVTCLVSRRLMMSGKKNANICSFAFKWLSVQKTSIPPCRFLVALRWKVRAFTNIYANSDKWGNLEAKSLLMLCKSVTLTFTNKLPPNTWMDDIQGRLIQWI